MAFGYDGKPGIVELEIPKYLISEFPRIDEVYYEDFSILGKQIPFQVNSEDNSYVTIRIDVPSNNTVFEVGGTDGGLLSTSAYGRIFGFKFIIGFLVSLVLFFLFMILHWASKKLVTLIRNKLGYPAKHE
jgi:hypothetical protein